ncbi:DPP IV N-terminal domain-containing protein [bacterium]|nr:DPP IV N-terminal domain-containing protein [bacterium]
MNRKQSLLRMTLVVSFAILCGLAAAQENARLTLENYNDPGLFTGFRTPQTWWLSDGTALIFDGGTPGGPQVLERLDPNTGKRTVWLDLNEAAEQFATLFPEGEAPRMRPRPQAISADGRIGYVLVQGDIYVLDMKQAAFTRITDTPEQEKAVSISPDAEKISFVRDNDLYVYMLKEGREERLTHDGSETTLNGTLSWVYWEEVFGRQDSGYWWSDDSKSIAFFQTDESPVSIQHIVDFSPWTPTVSTQRYPKVGETNPGIKAGIADIGSEGVTWVAIDPGSYEYIVRLNWMPDNQRLCVRTLNRLHTVMDIYFADRETGSAELIMKETNPCWINVSDDLYFLKDGKHFIMASERSGYDHLYRFTMDGKVVNQITSGEWAIRSSGGPFWLRQAVKGIDEKGGWIYFTGQKESALEKQFYRIRFDGRGMERLSQGRGTHGITMSPDCRYYFDSYSNISRPRSLALHRADGKEKLVLAEPDPGAFEKYNLQLAELMHVPARDGFPIPVSVTKPADFDPSKKYPVIVYVYGGPSAQQVVDSWQRGAIWENVLLNAGYICMKIDNRAASAVSKDLENLLYLNTPGVVELNDLVDAAQYFKKLPWIDPDRWGIWGWSGGGTNTILAMTRSKEFKAGIAGGSMIDYRFYDTVWGETMMKTEKENKEGFEACSLLNYAKDLHGKLMLVHGSHDDNVHIQQVWRFVDKLVDANKLFELMVYPNRGHGVGDPAGRRHLDHLMLDFWERNL